MESLILLGVIGMICLIFGAYLLIAKIVTIPRRVDMVLLWLFLLVSFDLSNPCYKSTDNFYTLGFFLLLLLVVIIITQGKYIVYNTKTQAITDLMVKILDERNINYELNDASINLLDYDNVKIAFKESLNSVEVKFKGIRKVAGYKDLIHSFKILAKKLPERAFPSSGVFLIIFGVIIIIVAAILYY